MSAQTANVQLTATLKANGVPKAGETVAFFYGISGQAGPLTSAGTGVTDANGVATSPLIPQVLGTVYVEDVKFAGDSVTSLGSSENQITFDPSLNQAQSQVAVQATTTLVGTVYDADVTGTLTSSGIGVSGAVLTVLLDGAAVGQTSPTDISGRFTFQIQNLSLGSHTIVAQYAGSSTILGSQASTTVTVGTSPSYTPYVLGGTLIGLAAIAGVYVLTR